VDEKKKEKRLKPYQTQRIIIQIISRVEPVDFVVKLNAKNLIVSIMTYNNYKQLNITQIGICFLLEEAI